MKKNIYILLTFWMIFPLSMQAQKEMNWWYFGDNAGLNFNETQTISSSNGSVTEGMPMAVKGPVKTNEGCFSLSDNSGNLLMSSDGVTIYNKKNEVMTNGTGLMGGVSSTQSGIIIPAPNNPNKFYVVTVAQNSGTEGIRYSVVNIDVDSPDDMGFVEVATKNSILKKGASYENILAVAHANGLDYWLVHRTGKTYYVWLLTDQGFSTTPKMYEITSIYLGGSVVGEEIMSVDNTKLIGFNASAIISSNFDTTTGVISDIQVLRTKSPTAYGGSFSPNGEYLYYSITTSNYGGVAAQIKWSDLRAGNVEPKLLGFAMVNIRLASDGRLYGPRFNSRDLSVIMNPDEGGTDIRSFISYLSGTAKYGLPNFIHSFYSKVGKSKAFSCAGYEAKLGINISMRGVNIPTKLVWDFGDGSEVKEQEFIIGIEDYDMNHLFQNSGLHRVTVTPYKGTNALTASSFAVNIIDCSIKTNRMIRQDLLNIDQLEINK